MHVKLLATKYITQLARRELCRAGCSIHNSVPGVADHIEIVALVYEHEQDLQMMTVWDVPREIIISSRHLYLGYSYVECISGYALSHLYDEDKQTTLEEITRNESEGAEQAPNGHQSDQTLF